MASLFHRQARKLSEPWMTSGGKRRVDIETSNGTISEDVL
jgi:hypothetical protein